MSTAFVTPTAITLAVDCAARAMGTSWFSSSLVLPSVITIMTFSTLGRSPLKVLKTLLVAFLMPSGVLVVPPMYRMFWMALIACCLLLYLKRSNSTWALLL
jgi:hypothetical protein